MSTDLATLGIKIDASEADQAGAKLDALAEKGAKAEKSTKDLETASSKLNAELLELVSSINNNVSSLSASAQAERELAAQTRANAAASAQANVALREANEAKRQAAASSKMLAEAERQASKAAGEHQNRIDQLRASIDPAGFAIDRVNAELAEASALFRSGAISAADYAQAQTVLTARSEAFSAKQATMNARLVQGAGAARMTSTEALNLSRQFADIGVTAAMGMNPLMILIQQGPQIADIMKTSGMSVKDVVVEFLRMLGIIRVVNVANAEQVVSTIAVEESAENAARAQRTLAASIAASAGAAVSGATANAALAASNLALVASSGAQEGSGDVSEAAGAAGAAADAGKAAEGAAAAFRNMGSAATFALSPIGVMIIAITAALAVLTAGFAIFSREVSKDVGNVTKGMGLTEKQLERLKDKGVSTTVTMGDTLKAFAEVTGKRLEKAFEKPLSFLKELSSTVYTFVVEKGAWLIKETVGLFFGGYGAIKAIWSGLPDAIGDILITVGNKFVTFNQNMINGAISSFNTLSEMANKVLPQDMQIGSIDQVAFKTPVNPLQGKASNLASSVGSAFTSGQQQGRDATSDFVRDVRREATNNRRDAIEEGAGDPEAPERTRTPRTRKPRVKKEKEDDSAAKELERQIEAAQAYAKTLKEETADIGANSIQLKRNASERAKALAPTQALKDAISSAQREWEVGTANEALRKLTEELKDQGEALEFETSLIGKNNKQREVMTAQRQIDLRLRDLERSGIVVSAEMIKTETDAILANASARGKKVDDKDAAEKVAQGVRQIANETKAMNDGMREAASAFGDFFGSTGQGFSELIDVITSYKDKQLQAEAEIAEARAKYTADSVELKRREAEIGADMARAEVGHYGDMLGAAKRMFKEKSNGWKILEAVEKAYRAYQLISQVLEITGVTKSIAADGAKTASSVANSGIRASADGVAAIAKSIASLPFPFNIAAGAATAGALIAFGVKLFGGGGGSSGASAGAEKEIKNPTWQGATDEYGDPKSSYSVLQPGRTTTGANDNTQVAFAPGLQAGNNSSVGNVNVTNTMVVQGNVVEDVLPNLQEMFEANNKVVVLETRQQISKDIAEMNSRQRIGGA